MSMTLTPDLLAQIQQAIASGQIQLGNPGGRSPLRPRQLHDLRLLPTKDDPRPTFFWSATPPRDGIDLTRTTEFPKLLWHTGTGTEVTVQSAEEQAAHLSMGYTFTAPSYVAPDPMDAIRAQWDALSKEDQELLLESQKQDRITALKAKLSALPEAQLQEMLKTAGTEPDQKRGPGRPRKDAA
jgi:hypothetical protein